MFNKLRKIIIAASCAAYLVLGTTAFAADMPESDININDIIEGEEGEELVISILDDGRFVTTPLTVQSYAAFDHSIIVGTGTMHRVTSSYNKSDSTYCYKYRDYEDARCAKCGKTGYKIYDKTWTDVKHKYKNIFSRVCTVCGYEK